MSPPSRWHHASCKAPAIRLIGGLPWCNQCSQIPDLSDYVPEISSLDHNIPKCSNRNMLNLSWPASVSYGTEREYTNDIITATHANTQTKGSASLKVPSFDYEVLDLPDDIRVLELEGGPANDPLHATLQRRQLRNFAHYEALSYTWADHDAGQKGETSGSEVIYLGYFWDVFYITSNCAKALRRVRYPNRSRSIWVDSICINQDNNDECSHQVQLMRRIYANAWSVIVYLGAASEDSDLAMGLLHRQTTSRSNFTSSEASSLKSLFSRPYFSRIWIVQEVALAKCLHFYCGNSEAMVSEYTGTPIESILGLHNIPAWFKHSQNQTLLKGEALLSLVLDTASCQCSDPRDRIFALFGLIQTAYEEGLMAEYHLSIEQVYTGITAYLMTKVHIVDVLRLASLTPSMPSLPSWVPNWGHCPQFFETYSAIYRGLALSYLGIVRHIKMGRLLPPTTERLARSSLEIVYHPEAKHVGFWVSPQLSNTGHLTIQGIYLGKTSRDQSQSWSRLKLSNQIASIVFMSPYPAPISDSQPPAGERELSIFLLADYSTLIALEPSNGVGEYLLVGAVPNAKIRLYFQRPIQRPTYWTPIAFCLLPFSDNELACMKDIVAQSNSFSYLGTPPKLLSWADSILHVQALLWREYPVNEEERRLWRRWLEMKPEGFRILRNENKLRSALKEVQSLEKKTSDWEDFHGGALWMGRCFISHYLTLFILDPSELQNRASECPRQDGDFVESSGACAEGSTLEYLREWARLFFLLLGHISGGVQDDPVSTDSDIDPESTEDWDEPPPTDSDSNSASAEVFDKFFSGKKGVTHSVDFPGENLSETARETWEHHFAVCRPLYSTRYGSFASILLKKILDQWLEPTNPKPKTNSTAPYESGKYWDWDWMEETMNKRMQIWDEFDRLRTRLDEHTHSVNLDLMCHKIYSRHVLGLDGLDNLPITSVTII
ncbi:Heterokaryon incompatibility protein (HET) domain containing protein [Hyaloscypha variabilis]